MKSLFTFFAILLIFSYCGNQQKENNQATEQNIKKELSQGVHMVVVEEVIQTSNYTYLNANENNTKQWMAVPSMEAKVGDVYYYSGGMVMKNFTSKELNRTFAELLFLEGVSATPIQTTNETPGNTQTPVSAQQIKVDPIEGGITISELMGNKSKYANKEVMIRGKVIRYNAAIMKTNWIHIQDGSAYNDEFDLTVTSTMTTGVGETITIKGTVILDKDFGAGYNYDILIENAEILNNSNL